MSGTEAVPSGINACRARNILVKPKRMDGPLLVVTDRCRGGLIYVMNACVPEKGCDSDSVNVYNM